MIFVKSVWWLVVGACVFADAQNVTENEIRPYEFTFNIVDFQHRSEKKDDDGLITGEYGFITADGIYHETAYATDKTGDFIITKMRHRKITSLKDAEEIFKDNPERAKMLAEALVKSCAGCELDRQETSSFVKAAETIATTVVPPPRKSEARLEKKLDLAMKEMMKVLNKKSESNADNNPGAARLSHKEKKLSRSGKALLSPSISDDGTISGEIIRDMVDAAKKVLEIGDVPENERESQSPMSEEALERMANDLFYRFNYTISSHSHWEDGFRDGRKDGEFNAKFREGVDTHVKYVSNEFGYQPNITLVPRQEEEGDNGTGEEARVNDDEATTTATTTTTIPETTYRGHYFNWFKK